MFTSLTDTELDQLSQRAFSGLSRMYQTAQEMFVGLSRTDTGDDQYQATWRQAAGILDAARESHDVHNDVITEARGRREARQAARGRVAAIAR